MAKGSGPPRRAGRTTVTTLLSKVAGACVTLLVSSFVVYAALASAPGDPVSQLLGQRATAEQRAALTAQLGLDDPLLVRYWHWLTGVLHGDLGTSLTYRQEVSALLGPRIVTTLALVALSALITLVIGIGLGVFGGVNLRWRPVVNALTGLGVAIPGFVAAALLIGMFAVRLGWFPTYGAGTGLADRLWHLTLPALALSMSGAAYIAQMTTAAVGEEAGREHVSTAVGRGLPWSIVLRRHVVRNAAIPVLTVSGLMCASLVAGTAVVESAFAIDGLGSLLIKSVISKDYAVVNAVSLIIVTVFVVVMTVIDLAQTTLDPRLRERR
ncbi:ABC transporter permease [Nonomuraea turcica]|uniref:ABC transporter permease n=1 Tax=Nonomuraea sp. G32 TaxID=3067274 RepID=UPI00273CB8E9|nr:ABC transporter permease [Nonomuraea sp. G32]MDP4502545.1 ABC transporter permease [Nonomuraea sp. G32]